MKYRVGKHTSARRSRLPILNNARVTRDHGNVTCLHAAIHGIAMIPSHPCFAVLSSNKNSLVQSNTYLPVRRHPDMHPEMHSVPPPSHAAHYDNANPCICACLRPSRSHRDEEEKKKKRTILYRPSGTEEATDELGVPTFLSTCSPTPVSVYVICCVVLSPTCPIVVCAGILGSGYRISSRWSYR
jgi:hypothetical protein